LIIAAELINNNFYLNSFHFIIGLLLFTNSVKATDVDCNFNGPITNRNLCSPTKLDAITSQNQNISIVQITIQNSTNDLITDLTLKSPLVVNYIPTKIFSNFKNLQFFRAEQVQLKSLPTNAIDDCLNLFGIEIFYNQIPTIEASFAQNCTNLHNVFLFSNEIETINIDAFKGLSQLESVVLSSNRITQLEPIFANSPDLQDINLENNLITNLDPNVFNGLAKLRSVALTNNRIKVLNVLHFVKSSNALGFTINITNNAIEEIDPNFFSQSFPASSTWALNLELNVCVNKGFNQQQLPQPGDLNTCITNYNEITTTTTETTSASPIDETSSTPNTSPGLPSDEPQTPPQGKNRFINQDHSQFIRF